MQLTEPGTLVLVGSYAPAARAYVDQLADDGALVLTIPREAVLNQDESYLMGIRSAAAGAVKQGRTVVVRSENWPEAVLMTRRLAEKRLISPEALDQRVRQMLARAAVGVLHASGARRLIVVGRGTGAETLGLVGDQEGLRVEVRPGS